MCIGVPQGSPVAPILFMLFTALLFKIFFLIAREPGVAIRGYVDDGLLTCRAKKEEFSATRIAATFQKVEQWAFDNGMSFDPNKFEAIHFSRKRNFDNVNTELPKNPDTPYNAEPRIVKPTPKYSAMRWLGIYFVSRLFFKCYAEKMASKRRKAVSGLNMLGKTVQGVEPYVMRQAVHACILPILTYAVPAWWPGKNRLDKKGKVIRNGVEEHLNRLNKV